MGWAIGFDSNWNRDIGYGVPAWCDHPGCKKVIDRGLSYVCGGEPWGGEDGCGLYFCSKHLFFSETSKHQQCKRCSTGHSDDPFQPSADHPKWIKHKATDPSWAPWRASRAAKKSPCARGGSGVPESQGIEVPGSSTNAKEVAK